MEPFPLTLEEKARIRDEAEARLREQRAEEERRKRQPNRHSRRRKAKLAQLKRPRGADHGLG